MYRKIKRQSISKKQIIVLITILSILILVSGYIFFEKQAEALRMEKYNELHAIADLKVNQIENWLQERKNDAIVVTHSPFFIGAINNWLQNNGNLKLKNDIINRLKPVQEAYGYENIFLTNKNGNLLLSTSSNIIELDEFLKQKITETISKKDIVFTDFYVSQNENKINIAIIAPIIVNENKTIATLIFRRDPGNFLYPLIQNWPTPSKSAETILLRVENDSIIYLNELRHRKNTAMKLKIPMTSTETPSVQAALGRTGLFEGVDYRGVKVLSDIRKIPGTNWIMVAKVDLDEILANLNVISSAITAFTILLIIACGIGLAFIYNSHQKTIYGELYGKEKLIKESNERFNRLVSQLNDVVWTASIDGSEILDINDSIESVYGISVEEFKNNPKLWFEMVHPDDKAISEASHKELFEKGKTQVEYRIIRPDGRIVWLLDRKSLIYDENGKAVQMGGIVKDITQRKLAEETVINERNKATQYFEVAGVILVILDKRGKVVRINRKGCDILQYAESEIVGKDWFEFIPKNIVQNVRTMFEQIMKEEIKSMDFFENPIINRAGEQRFIEWHNVILRDKEGKPIGSLSSGEDVTERKLSEKLILAQRDLGIVLNTATNLLDCFRISFNTLSEISGMDCGMIYLFDKDYSSLDIVYSEGLSDKFVEAVSHIKADSPKAEILKIGVPVYLQYKEFPANLLEFEKEENLKSIAIIPMYYEDKVYGAITLASKKEIEIPDYLRNGIESTTSIITNAIVRIQIEEEVRMHRENLEQLIKERTAELLKREKELQEAKEAADNANRAKSIFLAICRTKSVHL
ncbi:PAS domain S-box protein [Ignavibacterium album]|uniref:PAS domain S-box protein n=1 Tax=Ignavibacterium album TaxID=591197 RepID=UPI0035B71281